MSVISCTEFIHESKEADLAATHLITSDGMVHQLAGVIRPSKGIFDAKGKRYVGAIGKDGRIYTSLPDINTIVTYVDKGRIPENPRSLKTTTIATIDGNVADM